jgi:hypothetical protein
LYLTVETILSPNLAKSMVGGRLPTTSTICSPPPVVPQEGLSREMKLSPPSPAAEFEVKLCVAGWTAIGLVVRGGLGSTLDVLGREPTPDISASNALVEGAELLMATGPKTVPAVTVYSGDQKWQGWRVIVDHTLQLVF